MEHVDKQTFKKIFFDHWEPFKIAYPQYNTPYYDSIVHKMLDCGDPGKMGFAQYVCTWCGETRRIAFSCKSSFCLTCAKPYTDRWVDFISRRLLPGVTYRHIVLTVPEFLHSWFSRDPALLSSLMQAGHACLLDVFKTSCSGIELDIGSIVVLQTAGRSGNYNPHLHILATSGGLDSDDRWRHVSYIPFEMIHRKWQYYLLTMLRENISHPDIEEVIDFAWKKYTKGFVAFVEKGEVPPGRQGLAQYLAKYVVSPPISVRRIERYDGHTVRYWYRDHRSGNIEHLNLPVILFIHRMVQHILPKGFQRIRYYGLHGNVRYANMREKLSHILPAHSPPNPLGFRILPRKPFAELFRDTFGADPLLCLNCGNELTLEFLHHPQYGTIKVFVDIFSQEAFDEQQPNQLHQSTEQPSADRHERMVQLSLPFL